LQEITPFSKFFFANAKFAYVSQQGTTVAQLVFDGNGGSPVFLRAHFASHGSTLASKTCHCHPNQVTAPRMPAGAGYRQGLSGHGSFGDSTSRERPIRVTTALGTGWTACAAPWPARGGKEPQTKTQFCDVDVSGDGRERVE
jgi:hypothetical protein